MQRKFSDISWTTRKMEFIYPTKKPLALLKSKLRPISLFWEGWGPWLYVSDSRKQINATYLYPSAFNGFDQLMFMHCFEDVNILMEVYIHICW